MKKNDFLEHLTNNIIPFWNKMLDLENGGFYGACLYNGEPVKDEAKGVILNDRILWFYSNAYMLLKDKYLLDMATHAYSFMIHNCVDYQNGGLYWLIGADGTPKETKKMVGAQGYAVYALASYFDASKNTDALNLAMKLFYGLETIYKDEVGYKEGFNRDFSSLPKEECERTCNCLCNLIEAYAELYRVSKNDDVKNALYSCLELFYNKLWDPNKKTCHMQFDYNYKPINDLESYGHDFECSWLILRASEVLGDNSLIEKYKPMILGMVDGGLERGYHNESLWSNCLNGVEDTKRVWWCQCEAMLGLANAYKLTGNKDYLNKCSDIWTFINDNMVTPHGEWIENYFDDKELNKNQAIAHMWKCPYHTGRLCMEMYKNLSEDYPTGSLNEDAIALYNKLKRISNDGRFLFGHQNSTTLSVNKNTDSDVRMMVNDIPGLIGLDSLALAGNEMNPESQDDSLKKSIEAAIKAYNEGAVITLSAHMPNFASNKIIYENGRILFNKCDFMDCKQIDDSYLELLPGGKYNKEFKAYMDLMADFFIALQDKHIPVIFRPFHEQNGTWFWWGAQTKKEVYINNFRYLKEYILSKGIRNVLWAYSPNGPFHNINDYLDRYPGDDIIDILALDYYDDYLYQEPYREDFLNVLDYSASIVYKAALLHNKIPAISECGIRVSKTELNNDFNGFVEVGNPMKGKKWFNRVGEIALKYNMPYYLVWGNFEVKNTYLPFYYEDGRPHEMMEDFIEFYNWDKPIFAHKQ